MNSETQHDPGYERRKAEFKREYIKRKRKERLIHNTIAIALRVLLVILLLVIGFKIVDRIFLPLSKTKQSQEVNKSQGTLVIESPLVVATPEATPSADEAGLLTIVNKDNPIQEEYVPNLVECYHAIFVDKRVGDSLSAMLEAAKEEGYSMYVVSGYRSKERQATLYEENADSDQEGYSEHQLGLAVDVTTEDYMETDQGFADTAEYRWLSTHCAEYGFVVRYPKEKEELTGHAFEPYHLRYVGVEDATKMAEQGLVLEEYKN